MKKNNPLTLEEVEKVSGGETDASGHYWIFQIGEHIFVNLGSPFDPLYREAEIVDRKIAAEQTSEAYTNLYKLKWLDGKGGPEWMNQVQLMN